MLRRQGRPAAVGARKVSAVSRATRVLVLFRPLPLTTAIILLLVLVTRLGAGLSPGDARAKLRRYQVWHPWQTDARTVETAWGMEARFGLSYWDALAVAAAAQSGCHYLLTQSLPHRTAFDQVTTLSPQHCLPSEIHDV